MSPISGQNCFCCGKISDKDPFPVIFFLSLESHAICISVAHASMCQQKETFPFPLIHAIVTFRVTRKYRHQCAMSTKGNIPAPAKSVSRYHARVARNLHFCHTRITVSTKGNFPAPAKVCRDITLFFCCTVT